MLRPYVFTPAPPTGPYGPAGPPSTSRTTLSGAATVQLFPSACMRPIACGSANRTAPCLPFIGRHDLGLDLDRAPHHPLERSRFPGGHLLMLALEGIEVVPVGDHTVFHRLGDACGELRSRERAEQVQIGHHEMGLV